MQRKTDPILVGYITMYLHYKANYWPHKLQQNKLLFQMRKNAVENTEEKSDLN